MQKEPSMVTLKKHKYLLLNVLFLCVFSLFVVKYCEEIHFIKEKVYYTFYPPAHEEDTSPSPTEETVAADEPIVLHPTNVTGNEWFIDHPLIYHAGGEIDGKTYTNSLEAITQTLSEEQYIIEIDFQYTSDNQLVCAHTWLDVYPEDYQPTLEEFLSSKIQGEYTPLSATDLINIMRSNPKMHVVIDIKEPENICTFLSDLVSLAEEDSFVLDRFIIQLYTGREKSSIQAIYPFHDSQFLFTIYTWGLWDLEVAKICNEENVSVITLPQGYMPAEDAALLNELGFTIYEHTVNRIDIVHHSLAKGISSFYTDSLSPKDLQSET